MSRAFQRQGFAGCPQPNTCPLPRRLGGKREVALWGLGVGGGHGKLVQGPGSVLHSGR